MRHVTINRLRVLLLNLLLLLLVLPAAAYSDARLPAAIIAAGAEDPQPQQAPVHPDTVDIALLSVAPEMPTLVGAGNDDDDAAELALSADRPVESLPSGRPDIMNAIPAGMSTGWGFSWSRGPPSA